MSSVAAYLTDQFLIVFRFVVPCVTIVPSSVPGVVTVIVAVVPGLISSVVSSVPVVVWVLVTVFVVSDLLSAFGFFMSPDTTVVTVPIEFSSGFFSVVLLWS